MLNTSCSDSLRSMLRHILLLLIQLGLNRKSRLICIFCITGVFRGKNYVIFGSNKAKLGVFWLLELSEGKNRVVFPVVNIGIIYQPTFSLDPKFCVDAFEFCWT